eukprot:gnl/TRDRNA2_/TRDRNA2_154575_c1_seq1.p1 gnl/TRDRNA2_/TRDRNA2_154575_c1~~gnl/TRDRNA2_/TRDRNA2_154575_c1_seq1.p1  ORF type:complete len:524 (-),score=82.00 gnl/TRDRNA2_/TRDRNA2_154575_c1_seq1:150-1721(-)
MSPPLRNQECGEDGGAISASAEHVRDQPPQSSPAYRCEHSSSVHGGDNNGLSAEAQTVSGNISGGVISPTLQKCEGPSEQAQSVVLKSPSIGAVLSDNSDDMREIIPPEWENDQEAPRCYAAEMAARREVSDVDSHTFESGGTLDAEEIVVSWRHDARPSVADTAGDVVASSTSTFEGVEPTGFAVHRCPQPKSANMHLPGLHQADKDDTLAELLLECLYAEGVDIQALPPEKRNIAFPVLRSGAQAERLHGVVGRQHQPALFERLVPRQDLLLSISREQFQLSRSSRDGRPQLTCLFGRCVCIGGRPLSTGEVVPLQEGDQVGFGGSVCGSPVFLIFKVVFKTRRLMKMEGEHSAADHEATATSVPAPWSAKSISILECVYAAGAELGKLPWNAKVIVLPPNRTVEIGRSHQFGFFERLLCCEAHWLRFMSRNHYRLQLASVLAGNSCNAWVEVSVLPTERLGINVESMSTSIVLARGRPLTENGRETLAEGDTLTFAAVREEGGQPKKFLEFEVKSLLKAL